MGSPGRLGSSALGGAIMVPKTAEPPGSALLKVGEDEGPKTDAPWLEAGVLTRAGGPRCTRYEARPTEFRDLQDFCETESWEEFTDNGVILR